MKNFAFILVIFALSACTNKSTPNPQATVTYHFTGSTEATYQVRYNGPDGQPVYINVTGTSWSKTVTASKASGYTNAVFFISLTSPNTVITGSADISVNDKVSTQLPLTFNSGEGSTDLTFYADVFK
jgi:hypothetical protein